MAETIKYFLKLDNVQGSSKERGHEGEIELDSIQWPLVHPKFSFTKKPDASTTALWTACADGHHFREAGVSLEKFEFGVRRVVQRATMRDVVVFTFQSIGPPTKGENVEMCTLTYEEFTRQ
jgi:type VI protein secretion system component Hcp